MNANSAEAEYMSRIRAFVFETLVLHGDPSEIPTDESLVDRGIVDSYGIVELATWLEREFAITIKDDEMVRDHFGSIALIARFILRKQRQAASSSDDELGGPLGA